MLESVLRAAIFVVAVWLIIAAVAAPFAMVHFSDIWIHATKKETPDGPSPNPASPLTPGVSADASILAELKGVNSNLVAMQGSAGEAGAVACRSQSGQTESRRDRRSADPAGAESRRHQDRGGRGGAAGGGHQGYAGQAGAATCRSGPNRARHGRYQGCAGRADPAARCS